MNNLKKSIIMVALGLPMMAGAAEFPWLTFKMTDGTEMSVAAEGLAINYNDGTLLLKSATVDESLITETIASMRFTATAAAVEGVSDLISTDSDYFDLSGKWAGRFSSSDEARKALPSGTYLVRRKGKTMKLIF